MSLTWFEVETIVLHKLLDAAVRGHIENLTRETCVRTFSLSFVVFLFAWKRPAGTALRFPSVGPATVVSRPSILSNI